MGGGRRSEKGREGGKDLSRNRGSGSVRDLNRRKDKEGYGRALKALKTAPECRGGRDRLMRLLVVLFGFFITTLGLVGTVSPARLVRVARALQTPVGLHVAAGIRAVFGAALFLVSPELKGAGCASGPRGVHLCRRSGYALSGGVRFRRALEWWDGRGLAFKQLWCGCASGFGLWLLYAVLP